MNGVMNGEPIQVYGPRYLFSLVLRHRERLIAANLIALGATLASVPVPLLMPLLVDEVLLDRPGTLIAAINPFFSPAWHGAVLYVTVILLVTLLLRLSGWLLTVWQMLLFSRISKGIVYRIRKQLLWYLGGVSVSEFESRDGAGISARLVTDLETLDQFMGAAISRFVVSVLTIFATAVVLLFLHWPLALFLLFLNPLVIYFTMAIGKRVKSLKKKENEAIEVFQQAVVETLTAMQQIRASNRDEHYIRRLVAMAGGIKERAIAFTWRSDASSRLSFLVFLFGFDVFRALGMFMVIFSDLTIGQMIAVFGYLWFMLGPIQEVLGMQYSWFGAKAALERINGLTKLELEPHYPAAVNPFADRGTATLEVRDLHLSYSGETPILNDVSLYVGAGEKVALVGASGGGKTTFIRTLLGLYHADRGQVLYNGVPVEKIGYKTVRENVGCVLQTPSLFNDTIRANLTLGRDAGDDELWQALDVVQLADFVRTKPDRLDTLVGLQGVKLSGGQRQRLAIARMLLEEPKVVILDEATSAIDSETETLLYEALFDRLRDKTTLIIAHRLSAVRRADRVYVFEAGHIIEHGAHEELLEENGLYARLFSAQV